MEQEKEAPREAGLVDAIERMNDWISDAVDIRKQCLDLVEAATRSAISLNVCDAQIRDFDTKAFYAKVFPKIGDQ